jgi:acid phosphatase family membrane protein YuiD
MVVGGAMLSLHCGCVVALECCRFTVDVWGRWNVTSLWMCGGARMLSLHCGCVVALECHFTVDIWWRSNMFRQYPYP